MSDYIVGKEVQSGYLDGKYYIIQNKANENSRCHNCITVFNRDTMYLHYCQYSKKCYYGYNSKQSACISLSPGVFSFDSWKICEVYFECEITGKVKVIGEL